MTSHLHTKCWSDLNCVLLLVTGFQQLFVAMCQPLDKWIFFWFITEIFICVTKYSCIIALKLVKGRFQWVFGNFSSCFFPPLGVFYIEAKKLLYVQSNRFHHNCHDWHFSLKLHLTLSRLKGNEALFSDVLNHSTDLVDKNGAALPSSLQLRSQEAVMIFIQERFLSSHQCTQHTIWWDTGFNAIKGRLW